MVMVMVKVLVMMMVMVIAKDDGDGYGDGDGDGDGDGEIGGGCSSRAPCLGAVRGQDHDPQGQPRVQADHPGEAWTGAGTPNTQSLWKDTNDLQFT